MVRVQLKAGDPPLPAELVDALREWDAFAVTVARAGRSDEVELLRRRGRQLASRVAGVLGRPVEFIDPVTARSESIPADPSRSTTRPDATRPVDSRPAEPPEPPGPTPWATGLAVAAFFAVFVAIADTMLSRAVGEVFGLVWLPANLLVGIGLAPSLYLIRDTPFWRWPAWGAAAGLVVAWVVLLLGLLGPS